MEQKRATGIDRRYSEIRRTSGEDFTLLEPLQNWTDLLASGISPADIKLIGINGGSIASAEYRIGLALGAEVGVIEGSGRVDARLLQDDEWNVVQGLVPMPPDLMTIRSFLRFRSAMLQRNQREQFARAIHEDYREAQADPDRSDDPSLLNWKKLDASLKESNRQQADDISEKLRRMGYGIRKAKTREIDLEPFGPEKSRPWPGWNTGAGMWSACGLGGAGVRRRMSVRS
jgi:hypothetical protein